MVEYGKLSSEEWLQAVQAEEEKEKRGGRLKIFFGMCAGVGKTYTMLREAHIHLKEGVDLVIGIVNTHGRKDTEKLLRGLPHIPQKWITYRGTAFKELDLDAILQRKPQLVLVDELAHTNVPGSRHLKRWQDVLELLDAGIDVYTTLNVQHVESRKDLIAQITGIQVRETVPDFMIMRADTIELIDISSEELLQRLKEGKVYFEEQSRVAQENFFKPEKITALRDIALRLTAEKVEHDLHTILTPGKKWSFGYKFLAAIGPSPTAEYVLRETARKASALDAPWVAVYVDRGVPLAEEQQKQISRLLTLAQDLGAETVTTYDTNVARGIQRVAKQKNVTQIIMGRSGEKKNWQFFSKTLQEELLENNPEINILVLRTNPVVSVFERVFPRPIQEVRWKEYGLVFLVGVGFSLLGYLLLPFVGQKSVGFIFLLGILGLSFFVGRGPIFLAAFLSALCWDIFFIAPELRIGVVDPSDLILLIFYFLTAATVGTLNSRLREQDRFLQAREEYATQLLEIDKTILESGDRETLRVSLCALLERNFAGKFDLLFVNLEGAPIWSSTLLQFEEQKEQATASWVFQKGKPAGKFTDTLPSAAMTYFPIAPAKKILGVLIYRPEGEQPPPREFFSFMQTICRHLYDCLARYSTVEKTLVQSYVAQIEKLHAAIFGSVSKGFYRPLERLDAIAIKLAQALAGSNAEAFAKEIRMANYHLRFAVDNILVMAEIESGFIVMDKKPHKIDPFLEGCIQEISPFFGKRKIAKRFLNEDKAVSLDTRLMGTAVKNLLMNAIENSPTESSIFIEVVFQDQQCVLSFLDEGTGIPQEVLPQIFEKFYRGPGSLSRGIGLGLAVVREIVQIHQGKIDVHNRQPHGTMVSLIIPIEEK